MATDYNGWKNRQTWNVALWINNDENLYRTAVEYVRSRKAMGIEKPRYRHFVVFAGLDGGRTPDNISWTGARLDHKALSEMLQEIDQ